jgi:hypothetical protein
MGQCNQTTLVTVTYPVINYILLTVADTFCLSDISPVPNCNNSQPIFLFRLISNKNEIIQSDYFIKWRIWH